MGEAMRNMMGESNPNWKGGRTVTEHGYVLIKMPNHHRADCRGYVYEHILVAEQSTGRQVHPGEEVHHDDRNGANNDPNNLIVAASRAEHRMMHRTQAGINRRKPGEGNPAIACACGCSAMMDRFDGSGRPRSYISGHNPIPAPTRDTILSILAEGPLTLSAIAQRGNMPPRPLTVALAKMVNGELIVRFARGIYGLPGSTYVCSGGGRRRSPGEGNPLIPCACGCGMMIETYDGSGRRRSRVSGHRKGIGRG